jgi:PIN domain nuclease of toxin-antitoxin system
MSEVVLDASAVLALLNQESGSEAVSQLLDRAAISTVNLSEVIAKLAEAGVPQVAAVQILDNLNLEVISFDQAQAIEAGMLRPITKSLGLSLGDRSCLALGLALNQPVITTDRQWANLSLAIEIRVIR